jgi:hypothetical protein
LEVSKEAASPEIQNTGNKYNKIKYNGRSAASRDFKEFFKNIKQTFLIRICNFKFILDRSRHFVEVE